ncbi:DUF1565 domain-containing protein [Iningainema tapete]|uniref:DUF1565 domain-containing protein n=1 Tax=Iningainema tapete BLCC-T55 TaxID=2748662 RepID=A0A8J6XM50_9CYAN|nr:DUF1565 domain-containing protein [Iningainema tapete]MBD2775376.1 DUF1565 domain-containing protein [Iningainema tapete BLCC-T55]
MRLSPQSVLFTASVGMAIALLGIKSNTAIAQTSPVSQQRLGDVKTMSQVNVLFVNPGSGDDRGNGGEGTPLKTITRALQIARPHTTIMLSSGTYSNESGEVFPLMLKPGVSIQGDSGSKGNGIVIQGGGDYLSRTFGRQNVTIVGANQAILTGVTVTNPNARGYGLWIEYSNPVVASNTFTGSTQDGISVTGNGAPIIRKNHFYRNGANGITIAGSSQPEVRENVFQQTGFGVNIAQNAQPLVVGNSIQNNRTGIVVQASSRPILRSNLIQNNTEDGLVALAQSSPDLGSAAQPGGNEFRNNARYDINASAAKVAIASFGNNLATNRIAGKVDLSGSTNVSNVTPTNAEAIAHNTNRLTTKLPNNTSYAQNRPQSPIQRLSIPPNVAPVNQSNLVKSTGFPTPSSLTGYNRRQTSQPVTDNSTSQLNYVRTSPQVIEFAAPSSTTSPIPSDEQPVTSVPVQRASNQQQSLPVLEPAPTGASALLPVPNAKVPIGNTGNMRKVSALTNNAAPRENSRASAQIDLRYRVIVEVMDEQQQRTVKLIAPNAFSTVWNGKNVMQVGVFSSRYNANNVVKTLNKKGLNAVVEPIN